MGNDGPMEHDSLLVLGGIVAAGIVCQWLAARLRLPSILVLLVVGAVAGQTGTLDPDHVFGDLLFPAVSLSVALILFEGSLGLGRRQLRDAGAPALLLTTVGAGVTFVVLWQVAERVLDIDRGIAALIAANLIVTGPTVIGPLLQQVRPRGRVGAILQAEGIIIDPIGAAAAIVVFELIAASQLQGVNADTAATLLAIGGIGTGIGLAGAVLLVVSLSRFLLPDHLRQPAVVAVVLFTFALSDHFQEESGLVAVTVLGLALANQTRVSLHEVLELAESLQVLVLSSLFLVLAARLDLDVVADDLVANLVLLAAAVLVARPLAVAASTLGSGLHRKERAFLAAVAPRGIVAAAIASVFTIRLDEAGIEGSDRFAGAVLTVLIGTIIVYGVGGRWIGTRLDVAEEEPRGVLIVGVNEWSRRLSDLLNEHGLRTMLVDRKRASVVTARLAGQEAVHGSILSSRLHDSLDLGGIGQLLALTASDEVNALAVERLRGRFGRSNTWMLAPKDAEHQVGRVLRWPDVATIEGRIAAGGRLRATRLSDEFDWDAYQARNPGAEVFGVIRDGRFVVPSDEHLITPAAGDVLVALGAPSAQDPDPTPAPRPVPQLP